MYRKIVSLLFLTCYLILSACTPQVTSTPETKTSEVSPTGTMSQTSEVLTETPVSNETTLTDPPPTATQIGTIDDLAKIYLSATGTLEAEINPDLGINVDNPIKFNLNQGTYIFNLGSTGLYSFNAIAYATNGYSILVDNPNKPGRGKVVFGGPGTYSVVIKYQATETATGNTFEGTLTVPIQVSGTLNGGNNNNGQGGGEDGGSETQPPGGGGEECHPIYGCGGE